MTPRPASPTSLLWAHQLKREHQHLLGRIHELESSHQQQETRIIQAERTAGADANHDIAALAERVKSIDADGVKQRLAAVEQDVMSKLDDVQAESEAVVMKVAALEVDSATAEDEKRKTFTKEKALLKRVGEVEENLKQYEKSLCQVNRKVDVGSVSTIKSQLESLTQQVQKEGSEMKRLEDSINALETANTELRKANERLGAEVMKLAPRHASRPAPTPPVATHTPSNLSGKKTALQSSAKPTVAKRTEPDANDDNDTPQPAKKKSHKWAGGGADRDIILQGSDVAHDRPQRSFVTPQKPSKSPAGTKKTVVKPTAPSKGSKKTATATGQRTTKPPAASKKSAKPTRKSLAQLQHDDDATKPIIRAGKGWFEVAVTPSSSEAESPEGNSVRRPRGRPRRSERHDTLEELDLADQRVTRGVRQQLTQMKTVPQKRKADSFAVAIRPFKLSNAPEQVDVAQQGAASETAELPEQPGAFSSLLLSENLGITEQLDSRGPAAVSPSQPVDRRESKEVVRAAEAAQPGLETAPKRRQILQYDDGAGLL